MSRVIVIGGGIVGVTSAWALLNDDHEVTLLEAGPGYSGSDKLRKWRADRCV